MTQDAKPPVGSTGKLAELQVGPGDAYENEISGEIYQAKMRDGRLANWHISEEFWGVYVDQSVDYYILAARAKPAPVEVRVKCHRYEAAGGKTEIGTCIKLADGSVDWSTWEPLP